MMDVHCKGCNRLLMKANTVVAAVKCPRCGKIFEYKLFSNLHITNTIDPKQFYSNIVSETPESKPTTG